MKYRVFAFEMSNMLEFLGTHFHRFTKTATWPGFPGAKSTFACLDIDEEEAMFLKLRYPTIKLYEIRDL